MLPVFVIAIMIWLTTLWGGLGDQSRQLANNYDLRQKERDIIEVAEAMELYFQEFKQLPADLNTLATTPGYEYVASSLNNWQDYSRSSNLTDGTWTFQRAAAYTFDRSRGDTTTSYLASNACGTNSFSTEQGSWCGAQNSRWHVLDTREKIPVLITAQRLRMGFLSQKFADYFNANGNYPNSDSSNVPFAASSIASLASLVGYAGSASNCTGNYQYKGIPLDCGDLFDLWGGAVGYQFENNGHVIFVSEPPIRDGSGNKLVIAVDRA